METIAPPLNLITPDETARLCGLSVRTLANLRKKGGDNTPPFVRLSHGIVRYDRASVIAWLGNRFRVTRSGESA